MGNKKSYTTHQIWIKKGHRLYPYFQEMTENAKNLYNVTNYYIRQVYTALHNEKELHPHQQEVLGILESNIYPINETQRKAYEKRRARELKKPIEDQKEIRLNLFQLPTKEKSLLGFTFLDALFKQMKQADYRRLPIHSSQQIIRIVQQNWFSYFRSLKDYKLNPEKYKRKPGIPKYMRKNKKEVYFSNQECSIKEEKYLKFPRTKIQLNIGKLGLSLGRFKQVRVLPRYNRFLVELIMEINVNPLVDPELNRIMGIDLGLNNVAAVVTNTGMNPILFSGKPIKSINQYYNKQTGRLKSILRIGKKLHEGSYTSKKMETYALKRHLKIKDLFHKVSFQIVNLALNEKVDTIVIGVNRDWKQRINLGKRNNQQFVSVPFGMLISMITYKANNVGIQVIKSEESYTSKASFLDCDPVLVYKEKETFVFSGKRINRGLYRSATGIILNADVNGAYNIIRKVVPNAFADGIEGLGGNDSVNVSTPLALNVR